MESSILADFIIEKEIIGLQEVGNVRVVDATNDSGVEKAIPKEYDYRTRFIERKLTPEDVSKSKSSTRQLVDQYKEDGFIAQFDSKARLPKGKWGFYGPGVEGDIS